MRIRRLLVSFVAASLVAACAPSPKLAEPSGFFIALKTCRARYAEMDAKIDAAGVRDGVFHRVPGFPYLRSDRMLASFRDEVKTVDEIGGWLRRMREFDQEAREFEFENLGLNAQERAILRGEFLNCGRGLAALEFDNPDNFKLVHDTMSPPDAYSSGTRALGLYPLTQPLLRASVRRHEDRVRAEFAKPRSELLGTGTPLRWQVQPVEDVSLIPAKVSEAYPDELGFPGLVDSAWRAIAEVNAPELLMAQGAGARQLGLPVWLADGHGGTRLDIDSAQAQVHYQIGFTRFGAERLIQVNYFFWFRTPDALPGEVPVDGLIWRVTLDNELRPIAYDSARASGREHFWFAVRHDLPRQVRPQGPAPFFPQESLAPAEPSLLLDAASGGVRGVTASDSSLAARRYTLARYEDLYRMPLPGGGSRSLFDRDGHIPGTRMPAPEWYAVSGVPQPGVLRHFMRLPVSYLGEQHFDDAFVLEQAFAPMLPVVATGR
ncbi:hypothetical protein [Nevskia sp.]|uniref:hypothetical protein n=1 Tax=Nevskia sp. TaxID=1929292 RepID=UPI0025E94B92|nr:hypothetical protein [Nevskia sp.]